jgi:hypothetical protein
MNGIKKTALVSAELVMLFIGTIAIYLTTDSVYATSKRSETSDQQNSCGNDDLALNISCQNVDLQVQGKDNAVSVNATHS